MTLRQNGYFDEDVADVFVPSSGDLFLIAVEENVYDDGVLVFSSPLLGICF